MMVVLGIVVVLILLTLGIAVAASAAARNAESSAVEEGMQDFLSTIMRQPAANDDYTLPDGSALTVHTLNLGASNAYLLETESGLVLVDAGTPFVASIILDYLAKIGRDDLNLIYITHAHIDHYGSAAEIRRRTGAPIAIHPDDAAALAAGATDLGIVRDLERVSALALPFVEPLLTIEDTEPDILVEDGDRLDAYGLPATVIHVPGHTPGSTAIVFDGGISFVGDLLAATGDPHVQSSYAYDWSLFPASLRHLAAYEPTQLYTGHGPAAIDGNDLEKLTQQFETSFPALRKNN